MVNLIETHHMQKPKTTRKYTQYLSLVHKYIGTKIISDL